MADKIKIISSTNNYNNSYNHYLEDIIRKQPSTNQCVVSSLVNGIVALKDNYIVKQAKNEKDAERMMNDLVIEIYNNIRYTYDLNLNRRPITLRDRVMPSCIPSIINDLEESQKYDVVQFTSLIKPNFDKIKELLRSKKGIISCSSPSIRHHQECIYKYDDRGYHFKDSLRGIKYTMSEEATEEHLLKNNFYLVKDNSIPKEGLIQKPKLKREIKIKKISRIY